MHYASQLQKQVYSHLSVRSFVCLHVCHTPVSYRNCCMHQLSFVNVLLTSIVRPILTNYNIITMLAIA